MIKVNLGCGNHYAEGWVNIDIDSNDQVKPDVIWDITKGCPYSKVDWIYAGHVFEHLSLEDVHQTLLLWRAVLDPYGKMLVVGPDVNRAVRMHQEDPQEMSYEELRDIRYGRGLWDHDVHQWRCTESKMMKLLQNAGWRCQAFDIAHISHDWPLVSAVKWQFAIGCVR